MNEQIQQLAKQAGISILYEYDQLFRPAAVANLAGIEKFAELIVKECADIALREEHDPYECIKKHFGVK